MNTTTKLLLAALAAVLIFGAGLIIGNLPTKNLPEPAQPLPTHEPVSIVSGFTTASGAIETIEGDVVGSAVYPLLDENGTTIDNSFSLIVETADADYQTTIDSEMLKAGYTPSSWAWQDGSGFYTQAGKNDITVIITNYYSHFIVEYIVTAPLDAVNGQVVYLDADGNQQPVTR